MPPTAAINEEWIPGWVNSEASGDLHCFLEFPLELSSSHLQCSLIAFSSLSHFPAPLTGFPVLPEVNCLYLNPHGSVCLWGSWTKADLFHNILSWEVDKWRTTASYLLFFLTIVLISDCFLEFLLGHPIGNLKLEIRTQRTYWLKSRLIRKRKEDF